MEDMTFLFSREPGSLCFSCNEHISMLIVILGFKDLVQQGPGTSLTQPEQLDFMVI